MSKGVHVKSKRKKEQSRLALLANVARREWGYRLRLTDMGLTVAIIRAAAAQLSGPSVLPHEGAQVVVFLSDETEQDMEKEG